MSDRRFDSLRSELLRAGVAARHVRRAVAELGAHFEQLVDDGISAGRSAAQAHAEAHETLGTDAVLIARYASRPELQAWPCRAPVWFFGVAPLVSVVALQLAVGFSVAGLMELFASYFSTLTVTREQPVSRADGVRCLLIDLCSVSPSVREGFVVGSGAGGRCRFHASACATVWHD